MLILYKTYPRATSWRSGIHFPVRIYTDKAVFSPLDNPALVAEGPKVRFSPVAAAAVVSDVVIVVFLDLGDEVACHYYR